MAAAAAVATEEEERMKSRQSAMSAGLALAGRQNLNFLPRCKRAR